MVCVILAADKNDKPFWATMSRELEKSFSILRAYGGRLDASAGAPDLVLTDLQSFRQFKGDGAIIVFRHAEKLDWELIAGDVTIAVVDSANTGLMERVAELGLPAITCGLSSKDTVTLSSIGIDGSVVNLQRTIIGFSGSEIEPQEVPAPFNEETDEFALMAAAVISLLCLS